ncbi:MULTISPECIES: dihydroneopterin aldolase [Neobacillus]|uniref:7,8-dihydroneopterin aldolase n=1 Tax=Neobacillus sedimentimangrovi TaxID=2699460 RepID=A0ABS8QLE6_9BACI|nr:dihydroneopterin aldolase [Neobacillus sedimentimangrovi]AIM16632.1 dihydroneopterin aldolase [Bacillus sp. X1(2014)]MCD4840096.1 dihydroneopterin aldolase [Neobacillus sedimentimangrovi]
MDKIYVNGMEFYGYHGVFPEENALGQRFKVDLMVAVDLKKAGQTDELEYSVHYGELYQVCKEIVEGKPYKLVETVAEKIAGAVLDGFPLVSEVTIKVIKPDPPIPGHYQSVAVEITRRR